MKKKSYRSTGFNRVLSSVTSDLYRDGTVPPILLPPSLLISFPPLYIGLSQNSLNAINTFQIHLSESNQRVYLFVCIGFFNSFTKKWALKVLYKLRLSKWLLLFQLQMFHYECPWPSAQAEITTINAYKTPKDKLKCVLRCSTTIMNLLSMACERGVPAADDFIPVLVYVLIKVSGCRREFLPVYKCSTILTVLQNELQKNTGTNQLVLLVITSSIYTVLEIENIQYFAKFSVGSELYVNLTNRLLLVRTGAFHHTANWQIIWSSAVLMYSICSLSRFFHRLFETIQSTFPCSIHD